jgi:hypothetical protein
MLICIQKMVGLLYLEWLNVAGGYAFKAMQGIIQTLPNRPISLKEYLILIWQKLCSIEQ